MAALADEVAAGTADVARAGLSAQGAFEGTDGSGVVQRFPADQAVLGPGGSARLAPSPVPAGFINGRSTK